MLGVRCSFHGGDSQNLHCREASSSTRRFLGFRRATGSSSDSSSDGTCIQLVSESKAIDSPMRRHVPTIFRRCAGRDWSLVSTDDNTERLERRRGGYIRFSEGRRARGCCAYSRLRLPRLLSVLAHVVNRLTPSLRALLGRQQQRRDPRRHLRRHQHRFARRQSRRLPRHHCHSVRRVHLRNRRRQGPHRRRRRLRPPGPGSRNETRRPRSWARRRRGRSRSGGRSQHRSLRSSLVSEMRVH